MSRDNKMGFFAGVAMVALVFGSAPVSADGHLIGAVDNTAPIVPGNFFVEVDLAGPSVTATWDLSTSDVPGATSTGNNADAGGANIVASNDVTEYIITRSEAGGETVEIRVPAGVAEYVDEDVVTGVVYDYVLTVTDGTNSVSTGALSVTLGEPPSAVLGNFTSPIALGTVPLGEVASQFISLSNAADALNDLTFGFVADEGFFAEADVASPLAPGASAQIEVGFDPALVGNINDDYAGNVIIETNDPDNREFVIAMTATIAGGTDVAKIDVRKTLAFGGIEVGESSEKSLKITNDGGETLNIADVISSDAVFVVGDVPSVVEPDEEVEVLVTFTPVDNIFYEAAITIISDDPTSPSKEVTAKGLGRLQGQGVKPVTRKIVKAKSIIDAVLDFTDEAAVEEFKTKFIDKILAAIERKLGSLPPGFAILIISVTEGSVVVDYEIVEPVPDDPTQEPEITAEEGLAALIEAVEDPGDDVFEELGTSLSIADETEIISLQPTDPDGIDIVGWFSRAGTRVDFDDFFIFADGFGSTVDSDALDILDIAGPSQGPPDGVINFEDFFRFADDFGKTVANAAEIQDVLGL